MANFRLWYSLEGRISRRTYWLKFVVPIAGLLIMSGVVDDFMGYVEPDGSGPAVVIVGLFVMWPAIVGVVKRFHDLGHSGRLVAGLWGGLLGSAIVAAIIPTNGASEFLVIPFGIAEVGVRLATLWFGIVRGTQGPNQYGPDPLGGSPMIETACRASHR